MAREDIMQYGAFDERLQETVFLGNGRLCVLASETKQGLQLHMREMICGLVPQEETGLCLALASGNAQGDARQSISEYAKTLDLRRALLCMEYRCGATRYRTECFVSRRYQVAVMRLSCIAADGGRPRRMTLSAHMTGASGEKLDKHTLVSISCGETAACCAAVRMLSDAPVSAAGGEMHTASAQSIVLFAACRTAGCAQSESLRRETAELIARAEREGYEAVRAAHEAEHAALYDRLHFELGEHKPEPQDKTVSEKPVLTAVSAVNQAKYLLLACGCIGLPVREEARQPVQEVTQDGGAVVCACGLEEYVCLCDAMRNRAAARENSHSGVCVALQACPKAKSLTCSGTVTPEQTTRAKVWRTAQSNLYPTLCELLQAARAAVETPATMHGNTVEILSALPEGWQAGKIQGLRLPDGLTLNLEWKNSAPVRLLVKAECDGTQVFRWRQKTARVPLLAGVWQEIMFPEQNAKAEQEEGKTA